MFTAKVISGDRRPLGAWRSYCTYRYVNTALIGCEKCYFVISPFVFFLYS